VAEVAKGIIDIEINTGSAASQLQALQAQINAFNLALNKNNKSQGTFASTYSKELQGAINKTGLFTAETIRLSTAANTLDKTLSKGKTSLGQFFSAKFNKNSAIGAETLALAAERAKRLQTQFIATSGAANGFQEALAVRPLAAFSSQAAVAAQKTQILSSMFKQGTTQLINFGKNVQWAGRQLMVGFTVPLTIFGAMAGKTFREIEKEAVNFKKVYGDIFTTDQEIEDQLKNVKELSKEFTKYGIAVKDTLQLAAIGAQSGKTGAELQEATIQATRLATLGDLDRQEAMRTTIALQSAFKLSNEDLGNSINFLNMVENSSVLSLQDLSEAIPRVAPVIVGLGGTVKEMAVFLTAMREGGVNAAEAANGLKSSLGRLISPTRQATEMANGFGISLDGIVQANEGNVLGMVISLSQAMKQLTDLQKQQLLSAVFGKFQFARMGALFENITREGSQASRVIEMMGMSIEDMASTADKELKAIEESAGTQMVAAMERFKLAIEPIGELFTKLAIPVLNFLTRMVEGFNSLSDGQKKLAAIGTIVIGVVIPALTMMAGLFLNLVGTLAKLGQGIALFGKGMITGGPLGAIKALTQSSKYLSLAEMDAAMAAQQLSGSSAILNKTLVEQAITGNAAAAAIGNLTRAYSAMIATQGAAGALPSFGVAAAAGAAARGGKTNAVTVRTLRRNAGGGVPGSGNTDTVPAMLTPGEFVINKKATKNNLGLLKAINDGGVQKFSQGGNVLNEEDAVRNIGFGATGRDKVSSIRRSSPKQQTGMTFAHMQKNIVSNDNPKIRNDFFEEIYQQYKSNFPKNPSSSEINKLADLEAGRLNNWNNWKAVGNLGFEISSRTNTALTKSANPTVKTLDFVKELDDLFKSGKNPYEAMLKNSGVPERQILKASQSVHASVSDYLQRMHSRGITTISDRILYGNKGPITSGLIPRAVIKGLKSSGIDQKNISELFKIFDGNTINSSSMSALRSGSLNLDELVKQGKIISHEPVIATKGANKGNVRSSGRLVTFNDGTKGIVGIKGTNISLPKTLKSLGSSENSKKMLSLLLSAVTKKRIKLNSGGPVPGSGNTDTVPAMLTPGEFVVNKKATSQNRGILEMMNGGKVQGYNKGGLVQGEDGRWRRPNGQFASNSEIAKFQKGTVASRFKKIGSSGAGRMIGGAVGMIGGYSAGKALTGGSEMGGIAGSFITPMLAKAAIAAAGAMKISAVAFTGIAAPLALAGFAIYKLNKSLDEARKSGAELSKAMYGSAETTKAMADAFGRETNASALRRKSLEKAGGQEITPEAVAASGDFMKSEVASQIIKDLELVKKSGEDVALALRNQLASFIISGAITPEEAKAIAADMGKAIGSETIAIKVAGQLSSLLGPNGEKIVNNVVEITAEISPKIDSQQIKNDAEKAYNSLNIAKKFGEFFTGGKESFIEQFAIDKIAEENSSALTSEAEARALLNLAVQEGTVALKEYLEQEAKITSGAKERSTFVDNANAQALGFADTFAMQSKLQEQLANLNVDTTGMSTLEASQAQALGEARAREDSQGKAAYEAIVTKGKESFKQSLQTSGFSAEAAQIMVDDIEKNLLSTDVDIFDKFISGQIPEEGIDVLIRIKEDGDLTAEGVNQIGKELIALRAIPDIDTIIDFKTVSPEEITQVYDSLIKFSEMPEVELNIYAKDNFSGILQQAGVTYDQFLALPDIEKRLVMAKMDVAVQIRANFETDGILDQHSRNSFGEEIGKVMQSITNSFSSSTSVGNESGPSVGAGGGGGSGKKTLAQYIKEFEKATKAKMDYFKATSKMLGTSKQEALALIDTEMYLKANKKQREKLISLAEKQLKIQKATAFLSMSTEEKTLLSLQMQEKALDKKSQKENKVLRSKQRQTELNNRALEDLDEKEEDINKNYDLRLKALDKVAKANDRLADQEKSRVDLASALASGDISAAASAANQMQIQNSQYQLEDTRAALEEQRERDIASLTTSVNGELLTREQIQTRNKDLAKEIETIEDRLYEIETDRLNIAEKREAAELRTFLLQQKQTIEALRYKKIRGKLTKDQEGFLSTLMVDFKNLSGVNYNQYKQYGGSIAKMANGGMAYKGSTESPPPIKMAFGSTVPGKGMTDKVPAMLTPGEFVVRKSVAQKNRSFLEALNSQVFSRGFSGSKFLEGVQAPTYSIPADNVTNIPVAQSTTNSSNASTMYNNSYSINVNVSGSSSSADEIANVVMGKIARSNSGSIRGSRY